MRLLKLAENEYILRINNRPKYFSSIKKLCTYSLIMGIDIGELETALVEMARNDHNFAEFGMLKKSFLFSGRV